MSDNEQTPETEEQEEVLNPLANLATGISAALSETGNKEINDEKKEEIEETTDDSNVSETVQAFSTGITNVLSGEEGNEEANDELKEETVETDEEAPIQNQLNNFAASLTEQIQNEGNENVNNETTEEKTDENEADLDSNEAQIEVKDELDEAIPKIADPQPETDEEKELLENTEPEERLTVTINVDLSPSSSETEIEVKPEQPPQEAAPDPPKPAAQTPQKPKRVVKPKPPTDPRDIALQRIARRKELPAPEQRQMLFDYAKERSIQLLLAEEYDQVAEIDIAIWLLQQSLLEQDNGEETRTLKQRLEGTKQKDAEIKDRWNGQIAEFKERANQKIIELEEIQQRERDQFEEEWSKPEALVPYSKPSPQLLQMRTIQKTLALTKDYSGAKQLKQKCEEMKKDESIEGSKRATDAMRAAYNQLLERQQKQMQCFIEHSHARIELMEKQRDDELQSNENLKKQLEVRMSMPKQIKKGCVVVPRAQSRGSTGSVKKETMTQFTKYKKNSASLRLDIKLNNFKSILKPMEPAPTQNKKPKQYFT